ncbi:MAG TPA: response regulator [Chitinophagaceae bacterium]|nr:response regulator [Chitinophagaceae bacterium]
MPGQIMIFDDDADILSICSYILQIKGWEVHTKTNCNNILEAIEKVKPDVIVMDNWIPDTGGIVATQTIKAHEPFKHIPVIYFSANHDISNLAKQAGTEYYLAKPFDIQQFEDLIEQVLETSRS